MRNFSNFSPLLPYIHLARLDKPIGIILLFIPCLWGIALCATPHNTWSMFLWSFVFLLGAVTMRSAGCIINDLFDARIDAQVERTKNRPLAAGVLNKSQAFIALALFLGSGGAVWLSLNSLAKWLSLGALALAILYPLTKRFFCFPQLILGLAFNSGVLIAVAHLDPSLLFTHKPYVLYGAGIFWTLYYDTIYALQDLDDDLLIGVRSTAVFFKNHIKQALGFFYLSMSGFITYLGYLLNADYWFYIAIGISLLYDIFIELRRFNPKNPRQAAHLFMQSILIGIAIVFLVLWP